MADIGEVYLAARKELTDFLTSLDDGKLKTMVPACPLWNVKDTAAHMTGVVVDAMTGDVPQGFMSAWADEDANDQLNEWTAGQVSSRRDRTIQEICSEWKVAATELVSRIAKGDLPEDAPPFPDRVIMTDLAAHTQDIYNALAIKRDRESAPLKIGLSSYIATLGMRLQMAGRPALEVDSGERQWVVGEGEPEATVKGTRFELFRSLSGRRSLDQLRDMPWQGDPEQYIDLFSPYGIRTEPLEE